MSEGFANIVYTKPYLGGDPEFFFVNSSGAVVGSEKVINKEICDTRVVCDGVQAELHPAPSSCRAILGGNYYVCMISVAKIAALKGLDASFKEVVKVTKKELGELSDNSRVFGCAPSFNAFDGGAAGKVDVDASVYRYRSAGGHIHLGYKGIYLPYPPVDVDVNELANLMDVIVGNTCVMLDHDPCQIERRKLYGKAGEYRTPSYGFEYRTLSNFWLRDYKLMALVYGLARLSYNIARSGCGAEVLKYFDLNQVRIAINTNNAKLARINFDGYIAFMKDFEPYYVVMPYVSTCPKGLSEHVQIPYAWIPQFLFFVAKGVEHWFSLDPISSWKLNVNGAIGWESFMQVVVKPQFDSLSASGKRRYNV